MSTDKKYGEYPTEEISEKLKEIFDFVVDWPHESNTERNRKKKARQKRKNKPKAVASE